MKSLPSRRVRLVALLAVALFAGGASSRGSGLRDEREDPLRPSLPELRRHDQSRWLEPDSDRTRGHHHVQHLVAGQQQSPLQPLESGGRPAGRPAGHGQP